MENYLSLFFIVGFLSLSGLLFSINKLGRLYGFLSLKEKKSFFFTFLLNSIFPKNRRDELLSFLSSSQLILLSLSIFSYSSSLQMFVVFSFSLLLFLFIIQILSSYYPKPLISFFSFIASLYLVLLFPLTYFIVKSLSLLPQRSHLSKEKISSLKSKILESMQDLDAGQMLPIEDQKIMASILTFKEKVAREVMIPRVNIFSLPSDTTIKEAGKFFLKQDYSRIPVYNESLDQTIGLLMYKDVLKIYAEGSLDLLEKPIETIVKPVIYAPENKRISSLFQEFRAKHTHMAIIVNEYGGTEGIVTIEDILEELVGEIEDEYDTLEERVYIKLPGNSWIVDAKMTIIDLEAKLDIHIPHSPEYETVGGYIFHATGSIPSKGWKLQHSDFEIEVLQSNERCVEKVKITSIK